MPLQQRLSWAADKIAKSSPLLERAPLLPSPAGPWGWPDGIFLLGSGHPKWCQWGPFRIRTARCRCQNRPRRPRKNVRLTQNPQPFWEIPSPLYIGSVGRAPGAVPRPPGCLYKYMCKREKSRPHQKNACSGEKTWGEPRDSLVESPIYWSKRLAHGVRFQLGESFFRGEDFASHPGAEVRPAGCTQQRPVDIALVPWGPASRMREILSPENSFPGVKQT